MRNAAILVTGASGFIGTGLREILAAELPDAIVVCVDRHEALGVLGADLLDPAAIDAIVAAHRPTHVLHLAGVTRSSSWRELYEGNVETTTNLLDSLSTHVPGCRIVIPSSAAEYGAVREQDLPVTEERPAYPISPYGVAKLWQSTAARFYTTRGLHVLVARIFNISGRGVPPTFSIGSVVAQLAAVRAGTAAPRIEVGDTSTVRDFIDVADVSRALVALADGGRAGEIYNVCSGTPVSIGEVFGKLVEYSGLEVEIVENIRPPRIGDIPVSYGSFDKIHGELGWAPTISLDESLKRALA